MKDLPHHMKKLNRRVIRSMHREENAEVLPDIPTLPVTKKGARKKAKIKMRDEKRARTPSERDPEERNRIMKKGRVPVFDREGAKPKHTRASKKKTPRI